MTALQKWSDARQVFVLPELGDVVLFRAELLQPENTLQHAKLLLSNDEVQRAKRFRFAPHRRRFLVARAMLRTILAHYLRIGAKEVRFEYQQHGKPKIVDSQNPSEVTFNLSHSREMAVLAVALQRQLGVDVEFIKRPLTDPGRLARRFFSEQEKAQFSQVSESQKNEAFFNCWTRKEAFIKAIGEGLTHPLRNFDVSFLPGEQAALLSTRPDASQAQQWSMHAFSAGTEYIGALAVQGPLCQLHCYQWHPEELCK